MKEAQQKSWNSTGEAPQISSSLGILHPTAGVALRATIRRFVACRS
jgi:hypothetical protein